MQARRWIPVLIFCGLAGNPLLHVWAAETEQTVEFPSARTAALGGTHAALADDLTTLFTNPAGFRSAGPQVSFTELTFGLSGPIFDMAGLIVEGMAGGSIEDLLADPEVQDLLAGMYAAIRLVGPISVGYVGNGLGLGAFNRSRIVFDSSGTVPTVDTIAEEELLLAGGYAFRLPLPESIGAFDLGFMLKVFVRGRVSSSRDLMEFFSAGDLLLGDPFSLAVGAGTDMGVLYTWRDWLSVGVVVQDQLSGALLYEYSSLQGFLDGSSASRSNVLLPVNLTAGVMVRPPLGKASRYFQDLKIALDYHDAFDFFSHPDTASNPILHLGLGAEVVLLEILSLRLGFYQGLLSTGLGLDLHWFELDLAVFGRELSPEPGMRPVYNLLLGLEFRH